MKDDGEKSKDIDEKDDVELGYPIIDNENDVVRKPRPDRGSWGNQVEFVLTLIGFAVGVGNIWRFPYLCMRNGGGAFLIPYFMALFTIGIPLFYMELYLGQFSSLTPLKAWRICPILNGLGWGMTIFTLILTLYSNIILAWILVYFVSSFASTLPWTTCDNSWNTEFCSEKGFEFFNSSVNNYSNFSLQNSTENATSIPAEEFWENNVLQLSAGIDNVGTISWKLVLSNFVGWFFVFLCLVQGIKSSGKVVYVTATLPYVLLTILLIRGITLPGALEGIKYYLIPDWSRLKQINIWGDACLQILYSLGPCYGSITTFASFNKFNHNIRRDAFIVPLANSLTSFYAGFVVFSVIGFLAVDSGLPVSKVIKAGPGLAFVAYPTALARLAGAPFWAIIFFLTLFNMGLGSQFANLETVLAAIVDLFPKTGKYKPFLTASVCFFCFLVGLLYTSSAGVYFFQIIDWYCASFSLVLFGIIETLAISWIYGYKQVSADIKMMIGKKLDLCFMISWCFLLPLLLFVCLIYIFMTMKAPTYGSYTYPNWSISLGAAIGCIPVAAIPIGFIYIVKKNYTTRNGLFKTILLSTQPSPKWGPADAENFDIFKCNSNISRLRSRYCGRNK